METHELCVFAHSWFRAEHKVSKSSSICTMKCFPKFKLLTDYMMFLS